MTTNRTRTVFLLAHTGRPAAIRSAELVVKGLLHSGLGVRVLETEAPGVSVEFGSLNNIGPVDLLREDVAIASAGVILAGSDPRAVLSVITLSRASYRKMTQNLWWAAGYNLVAVPLAAGVLAPVGFVMPMAAGAVLMSLSTVVVAANAQLLRRIDLSPEASMRALGVAGADSGRHAVGREASGRDRAPAGDGDPDE